MTDPQDFTCLWLERRYGVSVECGWPEESDWSEPGSEPILEDAGEVEMTVRVGGEVLMKWIVCDIGGLLAAEPHDDDLIREYLAALNAWKAATR